MPKYPMTDAIASRKYTLVTESEQVSIHVEVGRPARSPESPEDWYAPWTIEKAGEVRLFCAMGVDALQALLMGLSALRANLELLARAGTLTLHGMEGTFIQLVGGGGDRDSSQAPQN